MQKVFVSGCFDMLHSGHVAFIEEAAILGDVYVGIGSDRTVNELKGRMPVNNEQERLYVIKSLKAVKDAWINSGFGIMDFAVEIRKLRPDIFFMNEDGFTPDKKRFCDEIGIKLVVSSRIPHTGLPPRSTTALRQKCRIPFRLDLAGGWIDQPFVSKYYPGPVITISIEPEIEFNDRSGMASSTRARAMELWQNYIPGGDYAKMAMMLFCFDNPPGTKYVSGSQDSIGIVFPGVNRLDYASGKYWPENISSVTQNDILEWIERHLWFINLAPRSNDFDVLSYTDITQEKAKVLSNAAFAVWNAILQKDLRAFGKYFKESFEAQIAMFPLMVNYHIMELIHQYKNKVDGWKISGAGGGGYLILVSEKKIDNAFQIRIRRPEAMP